MINTKLSGRTAITTLVAAVALISVTEWRALSAQDHPAPRVIGMQYCTSCHADSAMLAKMKEKEGSSHFLFHGPSNACPRPKPDATKSSWSK